MYPRVDSDLTPADSPPMSTPDTRRFVVGLRAVAGSRIALIRLAARRVARIDGVALDGGCSLIRCYAGADGDFAAMAVLYRTARSCHEIVAALADLERSLGLELTLLWMAGEARHAADPAHAWPRLECERWANDVFVEAGEHALVAATEAGREPVASTRSIANACRDLETSTPGPIWSCSPAGPRRWRHESLGDGRRLHSCGVDPPDLYAAAADLLIYAGLAADAGDELRDVVDRLLERGRQTRRIPLHVALTPATSTDDRLLRWLVGVAAQVDPSIQLTHVIVREVDASAVRGEAYGDDAATPAPLPAVRAVRTGRSAGEPVPVFTVAIDTFTRTSSA